MRKYSGFLESFKTDHRQLEMGHEKLCVKALKCVRWMSYYNDIEEVSFHPVNECQKDSQEQISVLKKELCNFIDRVVLNNIVGNIVQNR